MVDWHKDTALVEVHEIPRLENEFDFRCDLATSTGQVHEWPKRAEFSGLKLVLVPSRNGRFWLEISGSLHKFFEGGTNWQDYGFRSVCETIDFLGWATGIRPERFAVRQMEAGINASRPPYPTAEILNNALGYAGREFRPIRAGNRGIGLDLWQDETRLKLYGKGMQYGLPFDVFRFEVGALCHAARTFGIASLADLTDRRKMERIGPILGRYAGRIAFDDEFPDSTRLTALEREILALGRNPRTYAELGWVGGRQFRSLVDRHGSRRIARTLETLVCGKWLELLEN